MPRGDRVSRAAREAVAERHWTCGRRLRERRHALGLTQADVVARISPGTGLTNRALSTMENGRQLDVGMLPELAAALDCSTTYLLGLTDDPHAWAPGDTATPGPAQPPRGDGPIPPTTAPEAAGEPFREPGRHNWILGPDVPLGPVPPTG